MCATHLAHKQIKHLDSSNAPALNVIRQFPLKMTDSPCIKLVMSECNSEEKANKKKRAHCQQETTDVTVEEAQNASTKSTTSPLPALVIENVLVTQEDPESHKKPTATNASFKEVPIDFIPDLLITTRVAYHLITLMVNDDSTMFRVRSKVLFNLHYSGDSPIVFVLSNGQGKISSGNQTVTMTKGSECIGVNNHEGTVVMCVGCNPVKSAPHGFTDVLKQNIGSAIEKTSKFFGLVPSDT